MDRKKLKIAEPCPKNFDEMEGEGHRRFCDHCDKHVHNISDLTRDEALALLGDHTDAGLCVVYTFDRADQVRFRDDANFTRPPKAQLGGAKRLLAAAAMVPILAGLSGCDPSPSSCSNTFTPIDEIIEAEQRFFQEVADLFGGPDDSTTTGVLVTEPYPPELMGEPMIDPSGLPSAPPTKPVLPPPPEQIDIQVEMMGEIAPETIEQLTHESPNNPE